MNRIWKYPVEAPTTFLESLEYHAVLKQVFYTRGLREPMQIEQHLDKSLSQLLDPFLMQDMEMACNRIFQACKNNEKILIYGDYDVDGMTAVSVLSRLFTLLDVSHEYLIPHRIHDGYGLHVQGMQYAKDHHYSLVVTVDTGVTAMDVIGSARDMGLDVIVTDHHQPKDTLPPANAILNPNRHDCPYPNKALAGVGVAFKLAHACLKRSPLPEKTCKMHLKNFLDYVTLGTLADVSSLTGENRSIVSQGLRQMPNSVFPGIQALVQAATPEKEPLTAETVQFRIIPKLNASGRLEHARLAAELLLMDQRSDCQAHLVRLNTCNEDRKLVEKRDTDRALELLKDSSDPLLIVWDDSFHAGVNGIVASRLVDRHAKPALVLSPDAKGQYKGSARAPSPYNLLPSLKTCESLCVAMGGHPQAAGLTLEASKLEPFAKALQKAFQENYSEPPPPPSLRIDAQATFHDIHHRAFFQGLTNMAPFGQANPEPVFWTEKVRLFRPARILKEKHLKLVLELQGQVMDAIGFNLADSVTLPDKPSQAMDIVYRVRKNYWKGRETIQLELIDLKTLTPS